MSTRIKRRITTGRQRNFFQWASNFLLAFLLTVAAAGLAAALL